MQRIFTLAAFLLLTMGAKAQTYSYLTFQHTDGTQKSLTANGLKITFSGNTLTATSMEGTTTLALTDLSKMFFTSEVSGVLNPTGHDRGGKRQRVGSSGHHHSCVHH